MSLDQLVEKDVCLRLGENRVKLTHLRLFIVELLPLIIRVHRVGNVVPLSGKLAHVLHDRVQSVLRCPCFAPVVFIENAKAQGGCHDLVWDGQHLAEFDEVFHLDRPVSKDKPFELDAEHVGKLAEQLLVRRPHVPPVMLVVVDASLLEV